MRILQVSTFDVGGGAEKVGRNLFEAYRRLGHQSWLAVGAKRDLDPDVLQIPRVAPEAAWLERTAWKVSRSLRGYQRTVPGIGRLRRGLSRLTTNVPASNREFGLEEFTYPGSRRLLELPPERPDVIQTHNLHGDYFDLRQLPELSRTAPLFLTLHDAWLLSGHCAHSFDCQRWQSGCGHCPDLTIPPAVAADATAYNWQRKRRLYARSRLFVSTPCRWLMGKVETSMLAEGVVEAKVIPYGLDLAVFGAASPSEARQRLGLPLEGTLILFTANWVQGNRWKDYETMKAALGSLGTRLPEGKVTFVALGDPSPAAEISGISLRFIPFQSDPRVVASYYQAADIYLHAARADTFPNAVLEALACGRPVVATAVGGIPEQVVEGETGLLTPPRDAAALASALERLVSDQELRASMGRRAYADAQQRFNLERQADEYVHWFEQVLAQPDLAGQGARPTQRQTPAGRRAIG